MKNATKFITRYLQLFALALETRAALRAAMQATGPVQRIVAEANYITSAYYYNQGRPKWWPAIQIRPERLARA